MEQGWTPIPGWENKYEVHPAGYVRHVRFKRILKPMRTGTKRPGAQRSKVRLSTQPRVDKDVAHIVLEVFVAPRPPGCMALHLNDDSTDNAVTNLRWGSGGDNSRQMVLRGRGAKQLLRLEDVRCIIDMHSKGVRGCEIAALFGISPQRVCDIHKGRTALK